MTYVLILYAAFKNETAHIYFTKKTVKDEYLERLWRNIKKDIDLLKGHRFEAGHSFEAYMYIYTSSVIININNVHKAMDARSGILWSSRMFLDNRKSGSKWALENWHFLAIIGNNNTPYRYLSAITGYHTGSHKILTS